MKKDIAVSFLTLVTSGRIMEAYKKHVSKDFRHHNPYFRGDSESLMAGMEENQVKFPKKIFEIKRILEDGNLVAVHSHVRMQESDSGIAVVHIFRFEGELIAELWDIGQTIPRESQNENGMF